ncbi:50S ribosomal protein L29 [Candidatus Curtissbacteria bacterium RIFCSPLOWO2_01_FULL_41_18]|uniref:Large ribosomal subunit protein uL29 n=2 Tax=Candidatus Curtissiibacteriota TaxID=1752717 RepID=A0A1F5FYP2_9BACT|nr:MAG: 50S ribosomal protein L29 [Candidatus Curtissbacteria bacterium RIFCSPHIGHO2_01_FULL_41_13]OGE05091.1 MAG: 50S ribosomal protein L29 [Candidatus Curtissbacteria bacterium RIFCSPLOWO2_01_FULL_41_18]
MKKKDLDQLKSKTVAEFQKSLSELEKEKTEQVLNLKMGKTKNVHVVSKIKKDIAQIKTLVRIKTLAQEYAKENNELKKETQHATS